MGNGRSSDGNKVLIIIPYMGKMIMWIGVRILDTLSFAGVATGISYRAVINEAARQSKAAWAIKQAMKEQMP